MPRATASPPATSTGSTGQYRAAACARTAITPTGLITASVEDMSRWLIVHLDHGVYNGTRVLSAAGIDQLHAGVAPMTDKSRYAMGWYEADIASAPIVTHNGDPGEFHSTMVISPSTGWGVVAG